MSQRTFLIQAEAGIRTLYVTGVHTYALPITIAGTFDIQTDADFTNNFGNGAAINVSSGGTLKKTVATGLTDINSPWAVTVNLGRSEERRVGKECRNRWWRDQYKNESYKGVSR